MLNNKNSRAWNPQALTTTEKGRGAVLFCIYITSTLQLFEVANSKVAVILLAISDLLSSGYFGFFFPIDLVEVIPSNK